MPTPAQFARALHGLIEPLHVVLYLTQEARDAWEDLGLEPLGQGYVAGRSAPMGPVGPTVAAGVFFNFNPALFDATLPAAWDIAPPPQVLATRAAVIEQLFGDRVDAPRDGLEEATALARAAVEDLTFAGRPLAAANAAVAPPGSPFADLWQVLAVLREHRGDGHVALLTASGLHPVEVLAVYAAWQQMVGRRFLQSSRLWDDEAWSRAEDGLRVRGWMDADGALTTAGLAWRDELEERTDELAATPYAALGTSRCLRLFDLLEPLARALDGAGVYKRALELPDRPDEER